MLRSTPRHVQARLIVFATLVTMIACGADTRRSPVTMPSVSPMPIMAPSRLTPAQVVSWFNGRTVQPGGRYAATVPVDVLARIFVEEGATEGITGDIAFVQSVIETGSFRFTGMVQAATNNFAGIGATTSGTPAVFADARTGVRAQIQHLRAYADAAAHSCSMPPLFQPCVDPRFHLVVPKGRAPAWNLLGNGNWATAPGYGLNIVRLYQDVLRFNGISTQ